MLIFIQITNAMNSVFGLVPSPASLRRPHRDGILVGLQINGFNEQRLLRTQIFFYQLSIHHKKTDQIKSTKIIATRRPLTPLAALALALPGP
jgi:hypothetical protein